MAGCDAFHGNRIASLPYSYVERTEDWMKESADSWEYGDPDSREDPPGSEDWSTATLYAWRDAETPVAMKDLVEFLEDRVTVEEEAEAAEILRACEQPHEQPHEQ